MGNEVFLYTRASAYELTARVPPQPLPQPGQSIALAFDTAKLHFFDPETEAAVAG